MKYLLKKFKDTKRNNKFKDQQYRGQNMQKGETTRITLERRGYRSDAPKGKQFLLH